MPLIHNVFHKVRASAGRTLPSYQTVRILSVYRSWSQTVSTLVNTSPPTSPPSKEQPSKHRAFPGCPHPNPPALQQPRAMNPNLSLTLSGGWTQGQETSESRGSFWLKKVLLVVVCAPLGPKTFKESRRKQTHHFVELFTGSLLSARHLLGTIYPLLLLLISFLQSKPHYAPFTDEEIKA